MFRRFLKIGVFGGVTAGAAYNLHKNNYEIDAIALVRIGRAATTVCSIAYDYKTKLYNRGLDKDSEEYIKLRSEVHKIAAHKLLDLCKANKGVYIKIGQHVGALDYLLPLEYVDTMKILHKDAPSNSLKDVYRIIKEDLKQNVWIV